MNIYAGREWGWGFDEHKQHGKLGGDDMKATPGEVILAPVAGTLTQTRHSVTITETDGWKTQCLELASTTAPPSVDVGDAIGVAGARWPHWHSINPEGVRVRARFLTQTKGELQMLGLNYNVPGPKLGTKVLYDPIQKLVTPPLSKLEQDVFTQSGGTFVSVDAGMWTALLGGCREIKKPDPVGVGGALTVTLSGTATPK